MNIERILADASLFSRLPIRILSPEPDVLAQATQERLGLVPVESQESVDDSLEELFGGSMVGVGRFGPLVDLEQPLFLGAGGRAGA